MQHVPLYEIKYYVIQHDACYKPPTSMNNDIIHAIMLIKEKALNIAHAKIVGYIRLILRLYQLSNLPILPKKE